MYCGIWATMNLCMAQSLFCPADLDFLTLRQSPNVEAGGGPCLDRQQLPEVVQQVWGKAGSGGKTLLRENEENKSMDVNVCQYK